MSAGLLWWTPAVGAPLVSVAVRVASFQPRPERQGTASQSIGGTVRHSTLGQADRLTITLGAALDPTGDATERTVRDRLHSLADHLLRGESIGVAAFAAEAWAGQATGYLGAAGDIGFAAFQTLPAGVAGTMVAGGRVVLRDLGGVLRREEGRLASSSSPTYTLASGVLGPFSGPVLIRERHTYPALRLAPDARDALQVADADGLVYRVALDLIQDVAAEQALAEAGAEQGAQRAALSGPSRPTGWRPSRTSIPWGPA